MKLEKIIINNFKNIGKVEIQLDDRNYELHAQNGYGKSSIADAVFWVMTGKLLSGSSDIQTIKPKSDTSKLVEVELIFDETSIKRTYQEKWTRTRGSTDVTLTGHETNCFIDGLPVQVTKFDEELKDKFNIEFNGKWNGNIFQLLIDPLYFGIKEDWQNRRKLVIDLVGDVTDEDVFNRDKTLLPLQKFLNQAKGKFENVKKIFNNNLTDLRKQETRLNAQIEVLDIDRIVSHGQVEGARQALSDIEKKIDELKTKKYQSEKELLQEHNNKIADLKTKYTEAKETDFKAYNETFSNRNKDLEQLRNDKQSIQDEFSHLNNEINRLDNEKSNSIHERKRLASKIADLESKRGELRTEFTRVRDEEFHTHDHLNCPNCGFDLNQDKVKEQEQKFNLDKAERKKTINEKGKSIAIEIENLQQNIQELIHREEFLSDQIDELKKKVPDYNHKLIEFNNKEKELSQSIPEFKLSKETQSIFDKINKLQQSKLEFANNNYNDEIFELTNSKEPYQTIIDTYNAEELNHNRAVAIKDELDLTIHGIAEFEQLNALLSEFIKVKLDILNDRVEEVFGDIKFQLVESNIKEGSWNEVCYVMDGDVPYHLTNSANKIRIGIMVCEAIKMSMFTKDPGIFYIIDNAEQITNRQFNNLTESQTISFVATDTPKESVVEKNLFNI